MTGKFSVGQRVWINLPGDPNHLRWATVLKQESLVKLSIMGRKNPKEYASAHLGVDPKDRAQALYLAVIS